MKPGMGARWRGLQKQDSTTHKVWSPRATAENRPSVSLQLEWKMEMVSSEACRPRLETKEGLTAA